MKLQKGFTIIELVVVIAIIAVLSGIVISNISTSRNKGKDAAARGNLQSLTTAGIKYFETNGNYNGFPTSTEANKINNALTDSKMGYTSPTYTCNSSGASCNSNNDSAWCAQITLKASTNTYCVSSSGKKLERAGGTCAAGVCN